MKNDKGLATIVIVVMNWSKSTFLIVATPEILFSQVDNRL